MSRYADAERLEAGPARSAKKSRDASVQIVDEGRRVGDRRACRPRPSNRGCAAVALEPLAAVLGELVAMLVEIVDERLAIGSAALDVAERVELERRSARGCRARRGCRRRARSLRRRPAGSRHADKLDVDLVELAEAALLRPLVAEHRPAGEEFERQVLGEPVGDDGADDAGGVSPGRSVISSPPRSVKVYISLVTMSLVSPIGPLEHLGELEDRRRRSRDSRSARRFARAVSTTWRWRRVFVGQQVLRAANRLQIGQRNLRSYSAALGRVSLCLGLFGFDLGGLLLDELDEMIDDRRPSPCRRDAGTPAR